jgi:AbrB family looped-hinge helix DNA binding protein
VIEKVDCDGKVTIPKKIRDKLKIRVGDKLDWSIMSEKLDREPSWLLGLWKVQEDAE